jgi:tyrosine-protein kinase Etk/Wzc
MAENTQNSAETTFAGDAGADELMLKDYVYLFLDNIWLIMLFTGVGFLIGYSRAELITPIYEGEATVQVDLISTPERQVTDNILGAQKFSLNAEFEVLRSRKLAEKVVVQTNSYIVAEPIQVPVLGNWLARNNPGLSDPVDIPFLTDKYVFGNEKLRIENLELPPSMQDAPIRLTVKKDNRYFLEHPSFLQPIEGELNTPLIQTPKDGTFIIKIASIFAKPGARFLIYRTSVSDPADNLRANLLLSEKASFSGILRIAFRHQNPQFVVDVVNAVAHEYVVQNTERRTGDIEKSLQFLDRQIPYYTDLVEAAENKLVEFRVKNKGGLLDSEIVGLVAKAAEIDNRKKEIEQRQFELSKKYTIEHPSIRALQQQLDGIGSEAEGIRDRISQLPPLQQDAVRLFREVNINLDTLGRLRASALQLNLLREGKINNIRVLDPATLPKTPISPNKSNIVVTGAALGFAVAIALLLIRRYLAQSIMDSTAIEKNTGINQFAAVPLSKLQQNLEISSVLGKVNLLSLVSPAEISVEILRSMCSAILFTIGSRRGSVILITGPTPGVGKSFISGNTATLLATLNKKVLLIDADLRKGHMNREFGVSKTPGLSDLIGPDTLPNFDAALRENVIPNLDLITTGHFPSDPTKLFLSVDFSRFLDKIKSNYDVIIIDSAPVLAAADASIIAAYADAVLLVARAELTRTSEIVESKRRIGRAGAQIAGYVFNGFDSTKRSYGYAYGYGYGSGYKYGYKYSANDQPPEKGVFDFFKKLKPKAKKEKEQKDKKTDSSLDIFFRKMK